MWTRRDLWHAGITVNAEWKFTHRQIDIGECCRKRERQNLDPNTQAGEDKSLLYTLLDTIFVITAITSAYCNSYAIKVAVCASVDACEFHPLIGQFA